MAQADQTVQNASFPAVRTDINNNLAALFSNSSGNVAPTTTVAHMDWIDTSGADPIWKKRNAANNGWITIGTVKTNTLEFSGTNVLPSQTSNSGKFLTTDGTNASWGAVPPGSSVTTFTSSDTWTKPVSGTMVYVEVWGGGAGGDRGATTPRGGGGGAFRWALLPMATLGATVTVTVGSGGSGQTASASATNGGNSSFGAILAGGGRTNEGGGGGWRSSNTSGFGDVVDSLDGVGQLFAYQQDPTGSPQMLYIGGRGTTSTGGNSVYGGGGGGGSSGTGGTSDFGGNGGGSGAAGSIPGGGGGASGTGVTQAGNGARGEVRVYVW